MPRKGNPWREADIRCPFYVAEDEKTKSIKCEGIFKNSTVETRFHTMRERERQLVCRCEAKFDDCEMYRSVLHFKYPQ